MRLGGPWAATGRAQVIYTCPSVSARTQRSLPRLIGRAVAEARHQSSLAGPCPLSADLMSKGPLAGRLLNGTCCTIWSAFPTRDHQRTSTWVGFLLLSPSCPQRQHLCRGSDRSDSGRGDLEGFPRCLTYPGVIYVAEATTDTPHCDTLEM